MPVRLVSVVFMASDPEALAEFWNDQVEDWYPWTPDTGEDLRIVPDEDDEGSLELVFTEAPKRPKVGKNRIHLDLNTGPNDWQQLYDDRLKYTDIRPVDIGQGEDVPWVIYRDPEGNEFCVLKPREQYQDCGLLAAVAIDCADPGRLAEFWTEVTGWPIVESKPDYAALRTPRTALIPGMDVGPYIEFIRNADRNPEPSPVMLGLESYWAHQHDADVARLEELGGRKVRSHKGSTSYTIVADPEGNEFRVVIPVWPPKDNR
jgi:predicted enzyme related to lactoylglutathione lyase